MATALVTVAEIASAPHALTDADKAAWATDIRGLEEYRTNAALYPNLSDALEEVEGTIVAKQLNAARKILDAIGRGEFSLNSPRGVRYVRPAEREAYILYGLRALYAGGEVDATFNNSYAVGEMVRPSGLCGGGGGGVVYCVHHNCYHPADLTCSDGVMSGGVRWQ